MAIARWSRVLASVPLIILTLFSAGSCVEEEGWTKIHEKGRCALKGQCGSVGFFGGDLPCPNNTIAQEPEDEVREKLVSVCGSKWSDGPVCCELDQIDNLETNLKRAESIIASCPACKENFFNLFCTFTCSPDQSTFVNVTEIVESSKKTSLVNELDNLWSDSYGKDFYDSCKDIKFGATGGKAMDFIGGGAKNYTEFLDFLGEKKFLGSPFQINFPRPAGKEVNGMQASDPPTKACNDSDEAFRCACVDCPAVCPALPEVHEQEYCYVGLLPCLSFAVIIIYCVFLLLLVIVVSGHVAYNKHTQRQSERLQLLHDAAPSDDEDEEDLVHQPGLLNQESREYKLNTFCDRVFNRLGGACARFPVMTISISVIVVALLSIGWINFAIEKDPVRLWVSPNSDAAREKAFFDQNFGPFYRAEQAFLVNDTDTSGPRPVLNYSTLAWWFDVENQVQRIRSYKTGSTLNDVCFNPTGTACVVQSLTGYFHGDFANVDPETWPKDLKQCTDQPGLTKCLPDFQQPLQKNIILGGWEASGDILQSQALVTTWVISNHPEGSEEEARAMDWEESLKNLLKSVQMEAKERGLRLSFSTEISLEQELNKSTNTDAKIVVISYIIMFVYASLSLGSSTLSVRSILRNPSNILVRSKFTLGVIGIVIVLMSVSASVGLFSAAGIKVTLIIAEVIPFLVLAVGVDNIFLIVHEFERVNLTHPDEEVDIRVARALGRMGPSILLSASTETIAFALGVFVGMPAVKNFAIYAAGAVLINAILQVTMFVSVLALNQRRVESDRADCFPFITITGADPHDSNGYDAEQEGPLQRFIRKTYAPALLSRMTKISVIVIFLGIFTAGLALIPEVALGLDQRIAIPRDSYLIPYFNDLYAYFDTGPPVYFVTKAVNATSRPGQQALCARFTTCDPSSVANVLSQEANRPNVSYLTGSTASWLDDFFYWLNPTSGDECCTDSHDEFCFEGRDPPWDITLAGMPVGEEFIEYLQRWLKADSGGECPYGGKAPYSTALVVDPEGVNTPATHFRTSHTPLRSQENFIDAYASARRIADEVSKSQGIEVFPYSKFYIFFDQYSSIVHLTSVLLGSALALILLISSVLLGSLATGVVVTVTVAMIVVDIMGTMALAGVSLNAVSLVNLIISVGISVEFCAHVARAFMFPSRRILESRHQKFSLGITGDGRRGRSKNSNNDGNARAWTALVNVGGSVFSGITITKLLGVCVLAFTRSKIFEVYYFRIWLALVVFAAAHALIWLPVALSLMGGEGYVDAESEGGLEEDLAARRYRALLPDDDYDSDD